MPTALVTGASSGIGAEIARELAAAGHDLILVARRHDELERLAETLTKATSVRARVVSHDLAVPGAARALIEQLGDTNIDVLINNAGFGDYGVFAEANPEKLTDMLQLNVVALTELARLVLPQMIERRSGRIMNVASTAAFFPGPLMATYYASKAYVLSLSEALTEELAGTGVTVTALCPGPVTSGFQDAANMHRSKLASSSMMTSEACAKTAVRGLLAGKGVVTPGVMNQVLTQVPRVLPRRFVAPLIRRVQAPRT